MDAHSFFKFFLNPRFSDCLTQEKVQTEYDREAQAFREAFNRKHPDEKLWINDYDYKASVFFVRGEAVEFKILVVRFIYSAGPHKGKSFFFMGSMLVCGSKYSKQYILSALEKGKEAAMAKAEVTSRTLQRWRNAARAHMTRFCGPVSAAMALLDRTGDTFQACLSIFAAEAGRFPLCSLR